ncbi:type III restriction protein res subunit [Xylanimonas cellulosilytica DSM 15894]|uniref:Type III restriction protein res subunit n=1 Tax=Xylanimonas cellulosilytica (strain DSM 15894 / JCM 12276 / CECT 5975 / KCTC 9989 / LMG 20990 / NBRC 107835 / XIL07) TaxID=446471 RepID=D1BZV1_XYLCX|nr:DEAD/DEAH box helicase [Xylanimonas cellulosilytica]ACZ32079.1 type III restriction protein res subunit [Xylanimonas cellulosilytica DSM 15894]
MTTDFTWNQQFRLDVDFGFLSTQTHGAPRHHNPRIILNGDGSTVLHEILSELRRCSSFTFSVAFVAPAAVAQLKQALVEFDGVGRIITSDYLGFNSPEAFAELHNLRALGIDVRLHNADGFHPKGYIFEHANAVTTMMGSSNLTPSALLRNHEWNLKVSASPDSDLAAQLAHLVELQVADSVPITQEWIEQYAKTYVRPAQRPPRVPRDVSALVPHPTAPLEERSPSLLPTTITPNRMQRDALNALAAVRDSGEKRAIVISATGTGKTILSALDVRAVNPRRLLFVVHREQILDRTIQEYRKVLGGDASDYGKLTGSSKDFAARYLFATVQTLAQPDVLARFPADVFDYVIVDEAHRGGSPTHRRVIGHFDPVFMLGMTATPERTDGFNVFELFHYNVPYEIRLNRALDEDMLTPFHYYGITDATFDDDTTVDALSDLDLLVSPQRVSHLIWALETYAQAGTAPRGLIFCSRTQEARRLSDVLNRSLLRGRPLRTASLTGVDSIEHRERTVEQLESGELDYILTVDVFNEGVDIPSINQVIMLRQTQSAIVFVQQLGRGLRKCDQKEYLVVLDFIGNYANNFLIPIALFGDDSLNKESLRQNLIAVEEAGALPGLSSVQFDKIAQQRVLESIRDTKLDDMARLKAAVVAMRNRVGAVPRLWDFFRFESVDPVVLATKKEHYPALVRSLLKEEIDLSETSSRALQLLSHEVLPAKRGHEFVLLRALLNDGRLTSSQIDERFAAAGLPTSPAYVKSAVDTLTLDGFAEADVRRYGSGIAVRDGSAVTLKSEVASAYASPTDFPSAVDDIIDTGLSLVRKGFDPSARFTVGRQYSRKEALRQLCWPRSWASTVYGYKVDRASGACPIFVTLHKSDEISASTAYEDALLDPSSMLWYTRSRRTLRSSEVQAIVSGDVALYVFVKKDDAEGTGFYFLGQATAHDAEEATMPDASGNSLDVVRMILRFEKPVETALFDYFHSTLID